MKIINKNLQVNYKFNLQNKNLFFINNMDCLIDIQNGVENALVGKLSSSNYDIEFNRNDISLNKSDFKILKIPNYFDFSKDLAGGNKTILKELLTIVLKNDLFSSESLSTLIAFVESIDLTELSAIKLLQNSLLKNLNINLEINLQDQMVNYLAEQTYLRLVDMNEEEVILNQSLVRSVYMEIIRILEKIEDKNILFLLVNPFCAMNAFEISDYLKGIWKLKNFVILNDKAIKIDRDYIKNIKLLIHGKLIDFSNIYDNWNFYLNFSNETDIDKFKDEFDENVIKIVEKYNFLDISDLNSYSPFEFLINS